MDENIFARWPLNESIAFRPVKPLYCTLLSHKKLLSPLRIESAQTLREACASAPPQRTWAASDRAALREKNKPQSHSGEVRVGQAATWIFLDDVAQHKLTTSTKNSLPGCGAVSSVILFRNLPSWQEKFSAFKSFYSDWDAVHRATSWYVRRGLDKSTSTLLRCQASPPGPCPLFPLRRSHGCARLIALSRDSHLLHSHRWICT